MSTVSTKVFCAESWAKTYAQAHYKTDPGLVDVYFVPAPADVREVRLIEVNEMLAEREGDLVEPWVMRADADGDDAHNIAILDVTPSQWKRVSTDGGPLPPGWTLEGCKQIPQE